MRHSLLSILSALLLSLCGLAFILWNITDPGLMCALMERCAPPEVSHLPAGEYAPVAEMISEYITGESSTFQHIFTVDGTEYAAFNQKEQRHMADVQGLFRLCRRIGWGCLGAVILIGLALRRTFPWRTFRRTLIVLLAVVAAVILLACIDFNSLFILFHKVAFTNDLWLLNPSTDLLIRLMPIEFFISYAAIIGGLWLLGMGGMLVFATIRINKTKGE